MLSPVHVEILLEHRENNSGTIVVAGLLVTVSAQRIVGLLGIALQRIRTFKSSHKTFVELERVA